MAEPAYIALTDDGNWALYRGDGGQDSPEVLTVGRPFEPGPAILEAVTELKAWAEAADYEIVTPHQIASPAALDDLFKPEVGSDTPGAEDGGA